MIVTQPREQLWAWLNHRAPAVGWSDDFRAMGLVRDDCLVAVAGYNCFVGKTCNMHAAVDFPDKVTRHFVREAFKYPFEQLELVSVMAWMDPADPRSLAIDLKTGFKEVFRVPSGAASGEDLILIQMNKGDCRWLIKGKRDVQR